MSGLRRYPELQAVLDGMEPGHRVVGWSILLALTRAQLRRRSPVVLDGVARGPEVAQCRAVAEEEAATLRVVLTECPDPDVHRERIEGRQRGIPDWYELEWSRVVAAREAWRPPASVDLLLDATQSLDGNLPRLTNLLGTGGISR